jgi:uncharacterized protein (TIGR00730 family)
MSEDGRKPPQIPQPPHPRNRREPLPECQPKAGEDDPHAPEAVRTLLDSAAYRRADQDTGFLQRNEARGLRLNLEYMKPELLLEGHGVRHTIVVFGSTRITEPLAAQRRIERLQAQLQLHPADMELQRKLRIAQRILEKSRYYTAAREFGQLVAAAAAGPGANRLVIMTGGGPGIMEAANRGAFDRNSPTVGLNIDLPHEQFPNPYLTPGLCFRFRYFALRKLHFMQRARALVAFPGGFGTMDELFEALTLIQTRTIRPLPVVLVGREYWERVIDFEFLMDEGVIESEDREIFWYAETAQQAWQGILDWYASSGEPLFDGSKD